MSLEEKKKAIFDQLEKSLKETSMFPPDQKVCWVEIWQHLRKAAEEGISPEEKHQKIRDAIDSMRDLIRLRSEAMSSGIAREKYTMFGKRLREAREGAGHNMRKFADAMGWPLPYLSDIERSREFPPNRTELIKIAKILNISETDFVLAAEQTREEMTKSPPVKEPFRKLI